ncbi:hypothetical protein Q1695_015644 [Nippostrongylus brasiliensis]|nr:hypothetical protein Q1695_015644 [Nippostrongylus brasiliensis]
MIRTVVILLAFIHLIHAQDEGGEMRPCQDLVDPRTGVSNCPSLRYLCNNVKYYNLMTQQCPKTCNRCPPVVVTVTPPITDCRDLVDPRTGVTNCPQLLAYCTNPLYVNLMRQQCPKTCGYCR